MKLCRYAKVFIEEERSSMNGSDFVLVARSTRTNSICEVRHHTTHSLMRDVYKTPLCVAMRYATELLYEKYKGVYIYDSVTIRRPFNKRIVLTR